MAENVTTTSYPVDPVENPDGTLAGLRIRKVRRTDRVSANGTVINRGEPWELDEMEIPLSKVAEVMREMADWMRYFASGEAAREAAQFTR